MLDTIDVIGCVILSVLFLAIAGGALYYWRNKRYLKKLPPIAKFKWKWVWIALLLVATSPLWWWGLKVAIAIPAYYFANVHPSKLGLLNEPPSEEEVEEAKKQAEIEAKKLARESHKAADLHNCLSAGVRSTEISGMRTVRIPASKTPVRAFIGIGPPQTQYENKLLVNPRDSLPADVTGYLVEGGSIKRALPAEELEKRVVTERGKFTTVNRLRTLPFYNKIGSNPLPRVSVYFLQLSRPLDSDQEITTNLEVHKSGKLQELEVEVGRKEVVLDLPYMGFEWVWIVPIGDAAHQSTILEEPVDLGGVSAEKFKQFQRQAQRVGATVEKVFPHLPYQALTMRIDSEEPTIFTDELVRPIGTAGARKFSLQLNAAEDDFLAEDDYTAAKVRIGWWKER